MKIRPVKTLLLALTALLGACADAGDTQLDGTISLSEPDSPFIAFDIWLKAGSQNDPPGKEGLASLTASLLEDGSTQSHSYEEILEKLYPMAAGYGSSVDKEMTVFRGFVHRDNLEGYYLLFKDAILAPAFLEEDFKRIKTQAVNYVTRQRRYSSDEELGKELLSHQIFKGTRYQHPEEGYVQTVQSLTLDDVKEFYADNFKRGNVVVGVGGGYPEGFVERVRKDFDGLPEGETASGPLVEPSKIEGIHALIVEKETNATAISFGFPFSLLRSDDDFCAMMVVNSWLGEHRNTSSHLYQVIREARGMNYGDYSYIEAFPLGHTRSMPPQNVARRRQFFQIWIRPVSGLKPGDLHDRALFATRAALRELHALIDDGMSPQMFETTRGFLKNYTVNFGSALSARLGYRVDDAFYEIPGEGHLSRIRPQLDELTRVRVNQAVKNHLQYKDFWIVFITKDAEGLKKKLVDGTKSPIGYPGDKPEEILREDEIIESFPIEIAEENIRIVHIDQVFEN